MITVRSERAALCLCVLLLGCAPSVESGFRDLSKPMGASSRFDAGSFAGSWQVAAAFGSLAEDALEVMIAEDEGQITLAGLPQVAGSYRQGVPGELIPSDISSDPLIVMWIDEEIETAAIGFVSGRYGALIDRDGNVPPDRAAAARDVFEFYGWNVSGLKGLEK